LITVLGAGWHATLTSLAGAGALQRKKEKKRVSNLARKNEQRQTKRLPLSYGGDRQDWKKKMNRDRQKFLRRNKAEIIYTDFVKSKLRKTERRSGRVLGTEMKTPENLCNNMLLI